MPIYELLTSTELVIPFGQVLLFVTIISLFMVFHRLKPALITSYLFTFYWGFILNQEKFVTNLGEVEYAFYLYVFCGLAILALAIISFFFEE